MRYTIPRSCTSRNHPTTIQRSKRPSQFCFAVRRSEQHGPEGTVSIEEESYGEGGGSAEDGSPGFPSSKGWKFRKDIARISMDYEKP